MTGVFLSAPRHDWCTPLSHTSSCMLVIHGPSQQSSKEEYKPWKWQRPCYQRGSPCQDPAGNWTTWRSANDRKEMQTAVVWSCFPLIRCGQNHPARHSERGKKTRRTMEEVGMDRPGVRQVPVGSGEQGKMEKSGCKIICGAPTTLAVRRMMMMRRRILGLYWCQSCESLVNRIVSCREWTYFESSWRFTR